MNRHCMPGIKRQIDRTAGLRRVKDSTKDRNESSIITGALGQLQIYKNQDTVIWYSRLLSGDIIISRGDKKYRVRGCEEGTADFFAILNNGRTLWFEAKEGDGKQRDSQREFQFVISQVDNNIYIVVKSVSDVIDAVEFFK